MLGIDLLITIICPVRRLLYTRKMSTFFLAFLQDNRAIRTVWQYGRMVRGIQKMG